MQNIILADCNENEVFDLKKGIEKVTNNEFIIKSYVSNWGRTSILKRIKRKVVYFYIPFKIFLERKKYNSIIGWQQFYSLIYCFYCSIFHVKKINRVYVLNFTYKKKRGIVGIIYYRFIKYILKSIYIDKIFVLSNNYIDECVEIFKIERDKFKAIPFGVPDLYETYKNILLDDKYILSIGRSNRDYEWLINQWKSIEYPLYIISDTYKPIIDVPNNVTIINNINGESQYKYIMNCKALILPIYDGKICSGDTSLLIAMSFKKNVIVTSCSTLSEMYISDKKDGFIVGKKNNDLKLVLNDIINNKIDLGYYAREKYLKKYSRLSMGLKIGQVIREEK